MFRNTVFTKVDDLISALAKAGIQIVTDDEALRRAYIQPKSPELDVEFARQLAMVACTSVEGQPLARMITNSSWNRFLPEEVKSYPTENQF